MLPSLCLFSEVRLWIFFYFFFIFYATNADCIGLASNCWMISEKYIGKGVRRKLSWLNLTIVFEFGGGLWRIMWCVFGSDVIMCCCGLEGFFFCISVQADPKVHPASCTMGNGAFCRGLSGRGVALTTHSHLGPGLRMSRVIPLLPQLWNYGATFTFTFTFTNGR
jgi:hypothetical protein